METKVLWKIVRFEIVKKRAYFFVKHSPKSHPIRNFLFRVKQKHEAIGFRFHRKLATRSHSAICRRKGEILLGKVEVDRNGLQQP
ncbi:hypothetical protein NPIL_494201 [Nephila pilipes]|uniref:Uncharacterized protein n=1 Tax=Nephila pilipes TaxID=299642 RepID=A0A8X6TQ02_NEPPI|nr:hypothetical protein NPIL_494201 [Nephila pilipes]